MSLDPITGPASNGQGISFALNGDGMSGDGAPGIQLKGRRIALFTGAYNHIADGVSLTLNRLVNHLERVGATVLVFAPTIDDPPIRHVGTLDPVRSIAMPGRPDYRISLRLSQAQERRFANFAPHLVHVATPDIPGRQAQRLARKHGVPLVASYHTHFSSYLSYYRLGWTESILWRHLQRFHARCDHTYVPSASMADVLSANGISEGVRLWPRGVEIDRFSPRHRDMAWRRQLGFSDEDVVVSLVSRLVPEKGLNIFAEAMDRVANSGLRVKGLVVGDGPGRAEMSQRLPDVVFVGHLSGDALSRAYASSDLFVFPSYTETFGNVTLEAMASGLPTICADATGSRSLVLPGRTGFLAPPLDASVFAAHVERLIADPELRTKMGLAARAEARRYAWPSVLDRMVNYYLELLPEPVHSGPPELVVSAP
jgi:phosphatidylinositol alpha 1,6-mannosyltransferase